MSLLLCVKEGSLPEISESLALETVGTETIAGVIFMSSEPLCTLVSEPLGDLERAAFLDGCEKVLGGTSFASCPAELVNA